MDTNDISQHNNPRNGKALAGILLLFVGLVLLVRQFDFFFFPHWLISWPMGIIALGLYIGAKSNFHKPSSFVLILLGCIFLIDDNINNADRFVWPLGIMAFGLWMILRKHSHLGRPNNKYNDKWQWNKKYSDLGANEPIVDYTYTEAPNNEVPPSAGPTTSSSSYRPTGDEYLDTVSVFGGVKKTILSKDFKGGEVVNIFGGAELDFTQADINGRIIVDITQIFGSTKIIIPSHWQVVTDIAAMFAGIDDKRMKTAASANMEKILVLKGVSIFAGVDIRSY